MRKRAFISFTDLTIKCNMVFKHLSGRFQSQTNSECLCDKTNWKERYQFP